MRLSRFCSGLELMSKFSASSSSAECPATTVAKLDICQCMLGCFGVSVTHQTQTLTAGFLTFICDLSACVYTPETRTLTARSLTSICDLFVCI